MPNQIARSKTLNDSADQEAVPPGVLEDPAGNSGLPGHSYFFDDSFNLLFYESNCAPREESPFFDPAHLDQHVRCPPRPKHGEEDISPADTIVPDKSASCQCQISFRDYLAQMEQSIKDHVDKALEGQIRRCIQEELRNWVHEAWYEKQGETSAGSVSTKG